MRKEYTKEINIYGSQKEIDHAIGQLNHHLQDDSKLGTDESRDRIILQNLIDNCKIKADILYKGNTVWSKDHVLRDIARALNSKPCKMTEYGNGDYQLTNYLYQFLTLCCGSIAHYNKYGWIGTYPTKNELKGFFRSNEFGENVVQCQPIWKTDCINIANRILEIF